MSRILVFVVRNNDIRLSNKITFSIIYFIIDICDFLFDTQLILSTKSIEFEIKKNTFNYDFMFKPNIGPP